MPLVAPLSAARSNKPVQANANATPLRGAPVRKSAVSAAFAPSNPWAIPAIAEESRAAVPIQCALQMGAVNDPLEAEADAVAERVTQSRPAGSLHAGPPTLRRASMGSIAQAQVPPVVHQALRAQGQPLDAATRSYFEPRLGHDLSRVRIHADEQAAQSAQAIQARAYTVNSDVFFAKGGYAPHSNEGKRLIAHELAHTIQQGGADHAGGAPHQGVVQRQPNANGESPTSYQLPPLHLPGSDLTLIPAPATPQVFSGLQIPLPASLRLTNALGVGSSPSFVADLNPHRFVLTLLDGIDLSASQRPGTPPDAAPSAENQQRIRLIRPVISLDRDSQSLRGHATLSIDSDYPSGLHGPTELDVEITSDQLGQFNGSIGTGPLRADFHLQLHYDTRRLEQALRPAFAPQGGFAGFSDRFQNILRTTVPGIRLDSYSTALQSLGQSFQSGAINAEDLASRTVALIASSIPSTISADSVRQAISSFAREISHPGFDLSGRASLFGLPLTRFSASAPTTVPLDHPQMGAPTRFPLDTYAYGVVVAPAGAVTSTPVPAFGVTGSSFNAERGISGTAAILPTLSPSALSAGQGLAAGFPTYAYAEVSYVRHITSGLDMGARLTVQVNSADLFGPRAGAVTDPLARYNQMLGDYQSAQQQPPGSATPPTPNVGFTIFGQFNAF